MNEEQAFLDTLAADPHDDQTRLVYSDWLEEKGQQEKADYLRLECRITAIWPRVAWKLTARLDAARSGLAPDWVDAAGRPYNVLLWRHIDRPLGPFPGLWLQRAAKALHELAGVPIEQARQTVSGPSDIIATLPFTKAAGLRSRLLARVKVRDEYLQRNWPTEWNVSVRLAPPGGGKSVEATVGAFTEVLMGRPGQNDRLVIDDLKKVRMMLGLDLIRLSDDDRPGR